jgi:hypothetical protein
MKSGDNAMPVTEMVRRAPLMSTLTDEPAMSPFALANTSLTTASPGPVGSRPLRRYIRFSTGSPTRGKETSKMDAGSETPSTSAVATFSIRPSAASTPSISAISASRDRGARVTVANTSAKRWVS